MRARVCPFALYLLRTMPPNRNRAHMIGAVLGGTDHVLFSFVYVGPAPTPALTPTPTTQHTHTFELSAGGYTCHAHRYFKLITATQTFKLGNSGSASRDACEAACNPDPRCSSYAYSAGGTQGKFCGLYSTSGIGDVAPKALAMEVCNKPKDHHKSSTKAASATVTTTVTTKTAAATITNKPQLTTDPSSGTPMCVCVCVCVLESRVHVRLRRAGTPECTLSTRNERPP